MSLRSLWPRKVEPSAPTRWLRQSLGLLARSPVAFAYVTAVFLALNAMSYLLLHRAAQSLGLRWNDLWDYWSGVYFSGVNGMFLCAYVVLAARADGRPLPVMGLKLLGRCALCCLVMLAVWLGGESLFNIVINFSRSLSDLIIGPVHELRVAGPSHYVPDPQLRLAVLLATYGVSPLLDAHLLLLSVLLGWFFLPVLLFEGRSVGAALQASSLATVFNVVPWIGCVLINFGLATIDDVAFKLLSVGGSPWLALILSAGIIPLYGALLYVSWRDVFMRQPENSRAPRPLHVAPLPAPAR